MELHKDYSQETIALAHEANDAFMDGREIPALRKALEMRAMANQLVVKLDDLRLNTPPEILKAAEGK